MFCIKTSKGGFVSRTSTQRYFGGKYRETHDASQAKQFTREKDASRHCRVLNALAMGANVVYIEEVYRSSPFEVTECSTH